MASLLTIPLELLIAVSSFISTPDLGALRLTCKQIEKSLYEWFSQEFFTKKQFMLTHKSLQALFDISKHASFSQKLSHVIIATNVYANKPLFFSDNDAAARYYQGYEDQRALLNTGVDREMLTESFKSLQNLQTVGIRDFNNHERSRDGINWSSWGAPTVHKETGVQLDFTSSSYTPQEAPDFLSRLFQNVVYALGRARRSPEEFEVLLRHQFLPDNAFNVPNFVYPAVEDYLFGLKKLLLRVDLARTLNTYAHTNGINSSPEMRSGRSLRRFLGYTPNLTHLRLNLPKFQVENNEQFLQWLAMRPPIGSQVMNDFFEPPHVNLAHLTALDLGQFQVRPNIILDVIATFAATLQNLEMWRITLSMDPAALAYDPKPNVWSKFFAKLAKVPQLQLTHIKVGMLSQEDIFVQFKNSDKDDAPMVKVKEYTGNKMGAFLKELKEESAVLWRHEDLHPTYDTEEDGDEDEDMADDDDDDDDDDDEDDDEAYEDDE